MVFPGGNLGVIVCHFEVVVVILEANAAVVGVGVRRPRQSGVALFSRPLLVSYPISRDFRLVNPVLDVVLPKEQPGLPYG